MPKIQEKQEAIKLRKKGFSYNEILREIPVAKSTLSLWLRSVGLSQKQKQRLTEKKLVSMKRGWEACRAKRILKTAVIKNAAMKEVGELSARELWLISVALYWAEGYKEKEIDGRIEGSKIVRGAHLKLSNSDPTLIELFLKWLLHSCKIPLTKISFRIFLHETSRDRLSDVQRYWSNNLRLPLSYFQKITWKKNKIMTKRKNIGENYFGLVAMEVRKSTDFNRKIAGWIEGICKNI